MKLSEIQWTDVDLVPQVVRERKQETIQGVVMVGRPFVVDALTYAKAAKQSLDPSIQVLKKNFAFTYVRLPINIRPRDEYNVHFLSVDVELMSKDDGAICWSMEPLRVEQEIQLKTDAELSAGLKLQVAELGGKESASTEFVVYQPQIEAFGIGQKDPAWEFRPTKGRVLSGIQLLHMIIQLPVKSSVIGNISLKADILARGLLWNYRAQTRDNSVVVQRLEIVGR